jgi:hypothetical protein
LPAARRARRDDGRLRDIRFAAGGATLRGGGRGPRAPGRAGAIRLPGCHLRSCGEPGEIDTGLTPTRFRTTPCREAAT